MLNEKHEWYAKFITEIEQKWKPHRGQIKAGQALFKDNIKSIFLQCGRKWGKTEIICYVLWRWALTNDNAGCYYIAPYQKEAKEIIWVSRRVQTFGSSDWIEDINNTELRIRFKNGSFIKLDGSDNHESHRGTSPHIVVYEEFKDHRPEFRNVMRPNLLVYNAPEIFIGTPPDRDCDFIVTAEEHRTDPTKFYYEAPSWENHHMDRSWLEAERQRLYDRGEGDVWEREYEAKFVKGGASKIFPMIYKSMVKDHDTLIQELHRDRKKLKWILWADPAAATCFAVLFVAINPYTKVIYALDELYETNQAEMTVKKIGGRIFNKRDELWIKGEWRQGYDEAATWFANEMLDGFTEYFEPSRKSLNDKDVGLSLIKDIMLQKKLIISSRCEKFYWELDNYMKDKNGRIPKINDHLIDNFRYILGADGYELKSENEIIETEIEDFRGARISDDFKHLDDSLNGFNDDYGEDY